MKKILFSILFLSAAVSVAEAKNALVVIAHGSPMESWRKPVLELETSVRNQIKAAKLKGIDYVRVALMEYTEPSVASVVKDCGLDIQSLCARRTGRGENGDGEKQAAHRARAHLLL